MQTTYWRTNDQLALVLCVNNMQLLQSEVHPQLGSDSWEPVKSNKQYQGTICFDD